MVWAVARSKAVVLLFLGHCLLLLVLFGEGGMGRDGGVLSLFNNALLSVLSSFAIISRRKRELGFF